MIGLDQMSPNSISSNTSNISISKMDLIQMTFSICSLDKDSTHSNSVTKGSSITSNNNDKKVVNNSNVVVLWVYCNSYHSF